MSKKYNSILQFNSKCYLSNALLLNLIEDIFTERPVTECLTSDVIRYLIGQNFVGQNFRHQAEISTTLFDFCLTFVSKYWKKFSTGKICRRKKYSTPSRNFDSLVRRIFVGQSDIDGPM